MLTTEDVENAAGVPRGTWAKYRELQKRIDEATQDDSDITSLIKIYEQDINDPDIVKMDEYLKCQRKLNIVDIKLINKS